MGKTLGDSRRLTESFEPDVFEFSVLGLPEFRETGIIWNGSALVFYSEDEEREHHPSEESWNDFWRTLDRIDGWSWRREYVDQNMLDGEEWSLSVVRGQRALKCGGANAYPEGFEDLMRPLERLVE